MINRYKQLLSILASFVIYTAILNWKIAALLVIGIGFHEQCHLLAAKKLGLKTLSFIMIPFMGGVAFIADRYKTYWQQAFVVIMGPVGGGLLALATAAAWHLTGYPFLAAAASWMLFLNIFNLFPLSFLDGGQLLGTITYSVNRTFGMVLNAISTLIAIFVLYYFNPIIAVMIAALAGSSVIKEIKNWKNFREGKEWLCDDFYLNPPKSLTRMQMAVTIFYWLLTVVILGIVYLNISKLPEGNLSYLIHNK